MQMRYLIGIISVLNNKFIIVYARTCHIRRILYCNNVMKIYYTIFILETRVNEKNKLYNKVYNALKII